MLAAMRELALLELNRRCGESGIGLSDIRARHGQQLAPLLVEASEKVPRVYLLKALPNQPGVVRMWVEDLDDAKRQRLPFNKPSGSQSAALGPVIKRVSKTKEKPPYGPNLKTQNTTAKAFMVQAGNSSPWSNYFQEVCTVLFQSQTLIYGGTTYPVGPGQADQHVLAAAIRLIPEKKTVFLSVVDMDERWPGDRAEYHAYLAYALADIKYVTGEAHTYGPTDCPLCSESKVTLYPNLRGTGINFANMDRAGAFPGLDTSQAWKGYGLCLNCADLLYIFKNHLLSQQFLGNVAGDRALLLPSLLGNPDGKQHFLEDWEQYLKNLEHGKIASHETDLLEFVQGRDDAQVVIHILWATFGQLVDEVRGVVSDILPSRLRRLANANQLANNWKHVLAPSSPMEDARFDLGLNMLLPLFKRPGGRKATQVNESRRLFIVKRQLAETLYHGSLLEKAQAGLWHEILTTARWYLEDITASGNHWGLLYEGYSEKGSKQIRYWTLAGWLRHLARLLYYLDLTGALPMETMTEPFEPTLPALKPYFLPGSGLNSPEKAFTFLLGILYGKVIQVQAARKVNVAANALTWLKRLNLAGRDLPDLYNKVREKLLVYHIESSDDVRAIVKDLGRLGGQQLGNSILLDQTATCYFLLLGQSVTVDVLPSKAKKDEE